MNVTTYEYKIVKIDGEGFFGGKVDLTELEEHFNTLGREGWEMVSMMDTNMGYGATKWVISTFRRPLG
jgi:hypothetical protein